MQLVVKYGAPLPGGACDLVIAHYGDDATVPMDQFPGSVLLPYSGTLEELDRVGAPVENAEFDARLYLAPAPDLPAYLKAERYRIENAGVEVSGAFGTALLPTRRGDDRTNLNVTYSAIRDGLRRDGATFNFADGEPRAVSNADMKAACLLAFGHVQGTFDAEAFVKAKIDAGEVRTIAAVDAALAAAMAAVHTAAAAAAQA